jgi:Mrp family chromosome partitioning ATPase
MLRRRPAVPIIGEVPIDSARDGARAALNRAELDGFGEVLDNLEGERVVLVSGGSRSEVAIGLAAAALLAGRGVLLAECDLGAPSLAERLGLSAAPGLSEHLSGRVEAGRILQPLIAAGPASERVGEPLVCVVGGEAQARPSALLDSDRFAGAIGGLRDAYDLVVLLGPPLEELDALDAAAAQADITIGTCGRREMRSRRWQTTAGLVLTD